MGGTMHTKNGMPRSVPSGLSGYLYVTGGEENQDTEKYSVGDIVRWFHKRKRIGMNLFEGVVLGVAGDGAGQRLLVFDPACEEPEVINARAAHRLNFGNASDDLQTLSKSVLYFKSAIHFSR